MSTQLFVFIPNRNKIYVLGHIFWNDLILYCNCLKKWLEIQIIDERTQFKKGRENTSAVTINIIRQKERNEIKLNLLNYLKRYLFAQRLW